MLIRFFKKNGWRYLPGGVLLVLCAWIQTRSPLQLGGAVAAANGGEWEAFITYTVKLLAVALGVFVTRFGWRWFIIRTSREMEVYLRDRLYEHMTRLPVSFYGQRRSGDLMSYAVNDVNAVRMMFGMIVAQVLNSLTSFVFSVSEMAGGIDLKLTLYALAPAPFAFIAVLILGRKLQARAKRAQEAFATLSGHVQENISGMRVLKAFAQENAQYAAYEVESLDKRKANTKWYYTGALIDPVIKVLFGVSYTVGLVYGGMLVKDGAITLKDYVAFNSFLPMIVWPIVAVGRISNNLQRGLASYKRLRELLDAEEIPAFERGDASAPILGGIEARHLCWQYADADKPALSDVNFSLAPGGVLGVVGPTGGGKSTLLSLISKLAMPARGQLFIGGRDVCDIPARALRARIGYVPQDGFLFDATLRENVDFFSGASDEAILRALADAGMADDLRTMPEGLDTMCGERGNHLSGGQRQRVALARALVRDPDILLLDDTLSAVDAQTERQILDALRAGRSGRTVVVISHRLSAVFEADEILYIADGHVLERGTHEALSRAGGEYAHTLSMQRKKEDAQ